MHIRCGALHMSDQPQPNLKQPAQPAMSEVYCPHCLHAVAHWMPVIPLFTIEDAMFYLLIPTRGSMYTTLWRWKAHLSEPIYAQDTHGRRHRMLTAEDIRTIRSLKRLTLRGAVRWMVTHGSREAV